MDRGTAREWHDEEGWGVLDSPATPGGCWAHASDVRMAGYRALDPGAEVFFEFEEAVQDGFAFRATAVWPPGVEPGSPDLHSIRVEGSSDAFASGLVIELDQPAPVRVFRGRDLVSADPTPGMDRRLAFELPRLWSGLVETAPGITSGWHHHDRNDSSLYVVSGILRFEFEGHAEPLDAVAGDFVHVPPYTVHRESNPTDEPSVAVIARVGGGIPTVNVDQAPPPHR